MKILFNSEAGLFDSVYSNYITLENYVYKTIEYYIYELLCTNMCKRWLYERFINPIYLYSSLILMGCVIWYINFDLIKVFFVVFLIYFDVILHKTFCYVILRKIRKIPRPSNYFKSLTTTQKISFIAKIGGVTTFLILGKFIKFLYNRLISEAAACIRPEPSKMKVNVQTEFWDEHEKEKRFMFNPKIGGNARTTTTEQLTNMISKRIMMIHIGAKDGTMKFCNCLPLRGNIMILPSHIIPKNSAEAIITKVGANPKTVRIDRNSSYRIPKTDLSLWYVPELGDQRDLTSFFPAKIAHKKQFVGNIIYNDENKIKIFNKILGTRGTSLTTEGGRFESIQYYFPEKTFQGLCMATFVAKDSHDMPFIGGFHLGGRNTFGTAGFVTREEILEGIERISIKPSVLPSHAGTNFNTHIGDINVGPLKAPHNLCVTNNLLADARCIVFGSHNKPNSTPKSVVVESTISESVTEHLGLERMHDKPYEMKDIMHKEVDIEGKTHTAFIFDSTLIDKAVIDFDLTLKQGLKNKLHLLGKLEDDVVLAGLDGVIGINSMNFSTACGFPMVGPKTKLASISKRKVEGISCPRDIDPKVLIEIEKLEQILLSGDRINAIFKASLKDEPTKIGKKKVRVFAGSNIYFIMLVRKYYLSISALMQTNKEIFECAVGLNVESPEWTTMMKSIYKYGEHRVVAGDYKSFDGRMSPRFMLASFKILINLAEVSGNYDRDDLIIMRGIATEICSPTYDYFGTILQFYGSNPSGHPLTVVTNSLVNSLYMRYVYYKIASEERWFYTPRFNKVVALMTYGDDNIMSVKKGYDTYNHTNIARILAESDITYTMADKEAKSVPFINGADAGFLKHNAVWNDELQLYRAVIDESSISKMLHAHGRSSIPEDLHAACTIKDALDKYAHFGEGIYTLRREQLKRVALDSNIAGLVGEFPTYREQIHKYCDKYVWNENPYPIPNRE